MIGANGATSIAANLGRTALPEFKMETYLGRFEFATHYHMAASDAETLTIRELFALEGGDATERFLDTRLGYAENYGSADLRAAIAATYDSRQPADVLCFAGAEEGVYAFYRTLLGADDHAVVLTPNYQSAESVPVSVCATTGIALDEHEGWTLHVDQVAAAIRPNTRVISINFPHNPTGKILERDRFDALVDLCRTHGIWLFSDEVYRLIERDERKRLPQVADVYERGVSLNVMSKVYGLPGLRIGWTACQDHNLLERMVRLKHYLSICNSAPSERLALIALRHRDTILARNRAIARDTYRQVTAFLLEFPDLFEAYEPDGGVVMFPRCLGREGVEPFCRHMVEEAGAVLLPTSIFASALTTTPTDRFRIGYGRRDPEAGLAAMRALIQRGHLASVAKFQT